MWYLVPCLPRSVGFGPVRSPPRLARTALGSHRAWLAPRLARTALGSHRAGVEDQVGMSAPHADQRDVHLRQQARVGPTRQAAAQGRAARLVLAGPQSLFEHTISMPYAASAVCIPGPEEASIRKIGCPVLARCLRAWVPGVTAAGPSPQALEIAEHVHS